MTAALTPALALAYLGELSPGVRAAAALGAAGERVAGDERLAAATRRLLDAATPAAEGRIAVREERVAHGILLAARASGGPAIAVVAGDSALVPLLRHDLLRTLAALRPPAPDMPS